jgi:hypothetical protein
MKSIPLGSREAGGTWKSYVLGGSFKVLVPNLVNSKSKENSWHVLRDWEYDGELTREGGSK